MLKNGDKDEVFFQELDMHHVVLWQQTCTVWCVCKFDFYQQFFNLKSSPINWNIIITKRITLDQTFKISMFIPRPNIGQVDRWIHAYHSEMYFWKFWVLGLIFVVY